MLQLLVKLLIFSVASLPESRRDFTAPWVVYLFIVPLLFSNWNEKALAGDDAFLLLLNGDLIEIFLNRFPMIPPPLACCLLFLLLACD